MHISAMSEEVKNRHPFTCSAGASQQMKTIVAVVVLVHVRS